MKIKILFFVLSFLFFVSTAQAQVSFNPIVIDDNEDIFITGHSDGPVDFFSLTGGILPNGQILTCPDQGEYIPYLTSGGDFSYKILTKPTPGDYECAVTATEWPLVNTGTVSARYQWKVKPPFELLFDPVPDTLETGKNIRLILRTSDPIQPLPNISKSDQIELYDSMGMKITIDDSYNPIINIAYFSTPSDPRVVYDLKFPSTYTGTISIQPHPTNVVRQDGATLLNPVPYVQFDLIDPAVVLDGSGNVINQETPVLDQYLTGAMLDPNITSASPQTLGGAILDIRSIMIYFLIVLVTWAFLSFFIGLFKR